MFAFTLRNVFFLSLYTHTHTTMSLRCDNHVTSHVAGNLIFHKRINHMEVYGMIRDERLHMHNNRKTPHWDEVYGMTLSKKKRMRGH